MQLFERLGNRINFQHMTPKKSTFTIKTAAFYLIANPE